MEHLGTLTATPPPHFIVWIFINLLFVKNPVFLYHKFTSYSKILAHLWNFITFLKLYLGKQPTCWVRAYAARVALHLLPLFHWYMGSECTYLGFSQRVTLSPNKLMSSVKNCFADWNSQWRSIQSLPGCELCLLTSVYFLLSWHRFSTELDEVLPWQMNLNWVLL